MEFETIVKVKTVCIAMQATFTFTIVSNAIPYEKVSKMLRFDTNIVGLGLKLKHLEHEEYRKRDAFGDI